MTETVNLEAVRSAVAEAVAQAVAQAVAEERQRWEAREREQAERLTEHARALEAARRLVDEGRIAVAQQSAAAALLERDEEAFRAFLEAAPARPEPAQDTADDIERSIFEALGVSEEYARRARSGRN